MTNDTIDYLKSMQDESYKALSRIGTTTEALEKAFKASESVGNNPARQVMYDSLKKHAEKVQTELDEIERLLRTELAKLQSGG